MSDETEPQEIEANDTLSLPDKAGRTREDLIAEACLNPVIQSAVSVRQYGGSFGDLSLQGLITSLQDQISDVGKDDLSRGEAMLASQAHTLDAIFNALARRAINAEYMPNLDIYLKLALRAQSQCRATWEAISAIKHPPVAGYVAQANIANGPQQVNNGAARAEENQNLENELLEENHVERLDAGKTETASGTDPAMETVG